MRNDYDAAMSWLKKVSSGPNLIEGRLVGAQFTAKHKTVDKALEFLDSHASSNIDEET